MIIQVAQLDEQQAVINEAWAQIGADQAVLTFAQENNQRFTKLAQDGYGPGRDRGSRPPTQIAQSAGDARP